MSRISKLIKWLSQAYSYSPKEILEAVHSFKKEIDSGKTSLSELNKGMQKLMILKYPELRKKKTMFGQWMDIAKEEKKKIVHRPVVIKTSDKEHPDQRLAQYWRDYRGDWPDLTFEESKKVFRKAKKIVVSIKADGELECLHYRRAGIPLVGVNVKTGTPMRGTTKCLMANHGSHLYINNPITVAFQKWCEAKGIDELIQFGEAFGMHNGKMLPFPPRPPGTSNNILLGEDWDAWVKFIRFWAFDLYKINNRVYFPKGEYGDRLGKLKEMFGMAQVESNKIVKNPTKYLNGQILREIDRRMIAGTKMRLSEDKSADGVIADAKKWLYSGYTITFHRPDDYLIIFKKIADTFSKMPDFAKSSFGMTDLFMVADTAQKGRYIIVPIPIESTAKSDRMLEIKNRPWIYKIVRSKRVRVTALRSFMDFVKNSKKKSIAGRKIKIEKTKIRKVFRLKLIKKGGGGK